MSSTHNPFATGQTVRRVRGFTLLELMVVVAIVALASSFVMLALRDSGQRELDDQAIRISAALEQGRLLSRATGVALRAELIGPNASQPRARLVFSPQLPGLPTLLLHEQLSWSLITASSDPQPKAANIELGPEPLISPIQLRLGLLGQAQVIGTDGLRPFGLEQQVQP